MNTEPDAPQASAWLRFVWGPAGPPGASAPARSPAPVPTPTIVPRQPYRQCYRADGSEKQGYPNATAARSGIRALRRRPNFTEEPGRPLNEYECPKCKCWHIGKIPKPKKKA